MSSELQNDNTIHELHFFIDESGDAKKNDYFIVGGILCYGELETIQAQVHEILSGLAKKILKVDYPQGIHAYDISKNINWTPFINSLTDAIQSKIQDIAGCFIEFDQEIFSERISELDEKVLDNKYLDMLYALIENILYTNSKISSRLADDVKIGLHIARRKAPVLSGSDSPEVKAEKKAQAQARGFPGLESGDCIETLSEGEVREQFTNSLKQWKKNYGIHTIECPSINYGGENHQPVKKDNESSSLLYLADIFLSAQRKRHTDHNAGSVVPESKILRILYNEALQKNTEFIRHIRTGDLNTIFDSLSNDLRKDSVYWLRNAFTCGKRADWQSRIYKFLGRGCGVVRRFNSFSCGKPLRKYQ